MEGSTTKLSAWFYAIYLFSISKNGVSAKELQRALGVAYKTAWRIGHKIRELMGTDIDSMQMTGIVEVDETLLGGASRGGKRGWGAENKVCLVGVKERGGKIKITAVEKRDRESIFPLIDKYVSKGTMINTDEFRAYSTLPEKGYLHDTVTHSKYQWANGDTHTNSIEGYWSNLKKSILGTHTFVTKKYLHRYLDEFDFRHNNREGVVMFDEIMKKI
jgi:transposase-like protein